MVASTKTVLSKLAGLPLLQFSDKGELWELWSNTFGGHQLGKAEKKPIPSCQSLEE